MTSRTLKMATRSWYFLYFSALTRQIHAAGLKTKALRFVVWDRNVPSSEISNFRLLIMTFGTSTFSLLKLASSNCNACLGPGSAMREKGKKRGERSEPSGVLGRGERPPLFPLPRLPLGSLRSPIFFFAHADFFLFPPMRSLVPGYCYAHVIDLPHSLLSLLTSRRCARDV